jgi:hypothetical protein
MRPRNIDSVRELRAAVVRWEPPLLLATPVRLRACDGAGHGGGRWRKIWSGVDAFVLTPWHSGGRPALFAWARPEPARRAARRRGDTKQTYPNQVTKHFTQQQQKILLVGSTSVRQKMEELAPERERTDSSGCGTTTRSVTAGGGCSSPFSGGGRAVGIGSPAMKSN